MYGIRDGKLQLIEESEEKKIPNRLEEVKSYSFLQEYYILEYNSNDGVSELILKLRRKDKTHIRFLVERNDISLWDDKEILDSDGKWTSTQWEENDGVTEYNISLNGILVESGLKKDGENIFDITYYDFDVSEMKKKFIDFDDRKNIHHDSQTRQWDLIVDEIEGKELFKWPLVTPQFCEEIIFQSEEYGQWTSDRHDNYPTHDILLKDFGYDDIYNDILDKYAHPVVRHLWGLTGEKYDNMNCENFIVKYDTFSEGWQNSLYIHHDQSEYTFLLTLNDGFEGGGTWFPRQKVLLQNEIGHIALHPTITHRHGARSVTHGTRYVLISFCNSSN